MCGERLLLPKFPPNACITLASPFFRRYMHPRSRSGAPPPKPRKPPPREPVSQLRFTWIGRPPALLRSTVCLSPFLSSVILLMLTFGAGGGDGAGGGGAAAGARDGGGGAGAESSICSPPKCFSRASRPPSKPWPTAAKRHSPLR